MKIARYKLIPYFIRVRKKKTEDYVDLENIGFFDFLHEVVQKFTQSVPYHDSEIRRILILDNINNIQKRVLFGTIYSGNYGYETDFFNVDTGDILEKLRKRNFSELIPYHFFIHFNKIPLQKEATLLIQQTFTLSVKVIFEKILSDSFKETYTDYILEINAIITAEDAIDRILNADSIFELQFTRKMTSKEITNRIEVDNYKEMKEVRRFTMPKRTGMLITKGREWLIDQIRNLRTDLLIIDGIKYDTGVLRIYDGEQQRTIDLENLQLQERMTIPEESLDLGERGLPTLKSMYRYAEEYFKIIANKYSKKG